jgi:hypothetical protein
MEASRPARLCRRASTYIKPADSRYDCGISGGQVSYPGLMRIFESLSESAHPNYEGLMGGYSTTKYDEHETTFSNRWMELHGDRHIDAMMLCMRTFHHEYNSVWPELMEHLENYVTANDAELEATKDNPLPS